MQSSSSISSSVLQLSPFLAIFIVLLHTPQLTTCQAWTNTPLLLLPTRLQQQQQQTSFHEVKITTKSTTTTTVIERISQPHHRWDRLQVQQRIRDDTTTTQLYASNSHNDHHHVAEEEDGDEASIMEIADVLTSSTTTTRATIPQEQQQSGNEVNGFIQTAQQAWTSTPSSLNDASNSLPLSANGDFTPNNNNNNNINNNPINNNNNSINTSTYYQTEESKKYLTLAQEAWVEFFSDQLSQEEFLAMALDAWRDNAASLLELEESEVEVNGGDVGGGGDFGDGGEAQFEEVVHLDVTNGSVEEQQQVELNEEEEGLEEINGAQTATTFINTQQEVVASQAKEENNSELAAATNDEQKWGLNAGMSFLSGLFSGSKQSNDDDDSNANTLLAGESSEEDLPYGLRMKDSSSALAEETEEDLPYGLRMKSSSSSAAPVMDETTTSGKGDVDAVNGNSSSSMNAKPFGGNQVTPKIIKGFTPPLKSLDKKQVMPPPSPVNKGVALPPMSKGVMKGKENSFSGGSNKLSSIPPPFVKKKGGAAKLSIQGKFAPKMLDMVPKKRPQGSRGGLSFLKSDKLSKEYKADKNYNPMNKGVTVETLKGLKIGQVEVVGTSKSEIDEEAPSKNVDVKADTLKAKSKAAEMPPATTLISDGMTAEEAEVVRKNRLLTEEAISSLLKKVRLELDPMAATLDEEATPMAIVEGMTAEEAQRARLARLELSDTMKEKMKARSEKKGGVGTMPLKTVPLKGPIAKTPDSLKAVSKSLPLKGGISAGAKGKGDDAALKKGLSLPPLAMKSFGGGGAAMKKKGFPSPPLPLKGAAPLQMYGQLSKSENKLSTSDMNKSPSLNGENPNNVKSDAKTTKSMPKKSVISKAKSNDTDLPPATPLITSGMTADEAERVRMNRMLTEEERASKPLDESNETVQPQDTPTAITEGMTAEEAERVRRARDSTTIDLAALQSRIRQLEDPTPTATAAPRPAQKSMSTGGSELKQLKETTALLETKLGSVLSHIDKLESKVEALDKQNLQLRRDNEELREELDELRRTVALMDCLSDVSQ